MKEDEKNIDFYVCLSYLANCLFSLGEKTSEEKLVKNILRSLPKRFDMKVTEIEEARDIRTIKVDEIIGSLLTFEMAINDKLENKFKGVSFKADVESDKKPVEEDTKDNLSNFIALLAKRFIKVMRRPDKRLKTNFLITLEV